MPDLRACDALLVSFVFIESEKLTYTSPFPLAIVLSYNPSSSHAVVLTVAAGDLALSHSVQAH